MASVDGIKVRLEQVKVVAVTCLGITSPLLASKRFDVCIMDEAGQTTLPVSILIFQIWLMKSYLKHDSCDVTKKLFGLVRFYACSSNTD